MRIFPPRIQVSDFEGFTPSKDIFNRAALGEGLTNIVGTVSDPLVVALDGKWGTGKSIFLKMWAGELRKQGFPVVFFDAFENDFMADAFAALAGQIVALSIEKQSAKAPAAKKFLGTALGAGKVILRSGIKIGVKAATMGALDSEDFIDIRGDVAGEFSNLADRYLEDILANQKHQKETIAAFRNALQELPGLLLEEAKDDPASSPQLKPLIFIIDELDRCRPLFALEILERIKHFFSVPNVHFVLGVHLAQLQNSVSVAYGPNVDAQTYLEKFINLTFHISDAAGYRHERVTTKFINHLLGSMEFKATDQDEVVYATKLIRVIAELRDISLRTLEQIVSVLAISLAYSSFGSFRPPAILGGLCVLKVVSPELYKQAKQGTLSYRDLAGAFGNFAIGTQRGFASEDHRTLDLAHKWWRFCTDPNADEETLKTIGYRVSAAGIENRLDIVPLLANEVVDRFTQQTR